MAEAKAREAEEKAQEAAKQKDLSEAKALEAEEKAKEAARQKTIAEEKTREAEEKAQQAAKQKELAEAKAQEAEAKAKEASKQKELAEEQANIAMQLTEEERQKKNQLEVERAEEKEAFAKEQYTRKLAEESWEEDDQVRKLNIKNLQNQLKGAYINNINARVYSLWNYRGAQDDWGCDVYVLQDVDGNVQAVDVQKCNLDDSAQADAFRNSIERAVYKASPLPSAPDDAVFDREILFYFRVN